MGRVSKRSVNYRAATGDRFCGNCVMFHPGGTCDLVEGRIEPGDVCDRWEGGTVKTEDLDLLAVKLDRMRSQHDFLADRAEELRSIDPVTANKYASQCWQITVEAYPILVKLFDACYPVVPEAFGWHIEQLVLDPMRKWLCKSEETPYLSEHHAPIGHEGLWHTPNKKHPKKEQLPAYIQNVRNALMRSGHGEQEAHAMAIGAIRRWSEGRGAWGHKGKVTPVVREAAQRALAEWEKLKEEHSG